MRAPSSSNPSSHHHHSHPAAAGGGVELNSSTSSLLSRQQQQQQQGLFYPMQPSSGLVFCPSSYMPQDPHQPAPAISDPSHLSAPAAFDPTSSYMMMAAAAEAQRDEGAFSPPSRTRRQQQQTPTTTTAASFRVAQQQQQQQQHAFMYPAAAPFSPEGMMAGSTSSWYSAAAAPGTQPSISPPPHANTTAGGAGAQVYMMPRPGAAGASTNSTNSSSAGGAPAQPFMTLMYAAPGGNVSPSPMLSYAQMNQYQAAAAAAQGLLPLPQQQQQQQQQQQPQQPIFYAAQPFYNPTTGMMLSPPGHPWMAPYAGTNSSFGGTVGDDSVVGGGGSSTLPHQPPPSLSVSQPASFVDSLAPAPVKGRDARSSSSAGAGAHHRQQLTDLPTSSSNTNSSNSNSKGGLKAALPPHSASPGSPIMSPPSLGASAASPATAAAAAAATPAQVNGTQFTVGAWYEGRVKRYNPQRGFGFITGLSQIFVDGADCEQTCTQHLLVPEHLPVSSTAESGGSESPLGGEASAHAGSNPLKAAATETHGIPLEMQLAPKGLQGSVVVVLSTMQWYMRLVEQESGGGDTSNSKSKHSHHRSGNSVSSGSFSLPDSTAAKVDSRHSSSPSSASVVQDGAALHIKFVKKPMPHLGDIFVHHSCISLDGLGILTPNTIVRFSVAVVMNTVQAVDVLPIGPNWRTWQEISAGSTGNSPVQRAFMPAFSFSHSDLLILEQHRRDAGKAQQGNLSSSSCYSQLTGSEHEANSSAAAYRWSGRVLLVPSAAIPNAVEGKCHLYVLEHQNGMAIGFSSSEKLQDEFLATCRSTSSISSFTSKPLLVQSPHQQQVKQVGEGRTAAQTSPDNVANSNSKDRVFSSEDASSKEMPDSGNGNALTSSPSQSKQAESSPCGNFNSPQQESSQQTSEEGMKSTPAGHNEQATTDGSSQPQNSSAGGDVDEPTGKAAGASPAAGATRKPAVSSNTNINSAAANLPSGEKSRSRREHKATVDKTNMPTTKGRRQDDSDDPQGQQTSDGSEEQCTTSSTNSSVLPESKVNNPAANSDWTEIFNKKITQEKLKDTLMQKNEMSFFPRQNAMPSSPDEESASPKPTTEEEEEEGQVSSQEQEPIAVLTSTPPKQQQQQVPVQVLARLSADPLSTADPAVMAALQNALATYPHLFQAQQGEMTIDRDGNQCFNIMITVAPQAAAAAAAAANSSKD